MIASLGRIARSLNPPGDEFQQYPQGKCAPKNQGVHWCPGKQQRTQTDLSSRYGSTERNLFRPAGAFPSMTTHPRLAPLRQAQGGLWAAFLRRCAAGADSRWTLFEISTAMAALKRRATQNLRQLTSPPATWRRPAFLRRRGSFRRPRRRRSGAARRVVWASW